MATVTRELISSLHEKINVTINKEDYLPSFQKSLKDYSKKANIPGFRKGMVPSGLIKKMYGNSLFVDEVLKTVDKEVVNYLETEKLEIFAQPLPIDMNVSQLDVNNPNNYTFTFEVGMKPDFQLPDLSKEKTRRYKVIISEEMLNEEVDRLRTRYGKMTEPETVSGDENVLNVTFIESEENGLGKENGIRKENSLLVKYFKESFRPLLAGKKKDDLVLFKLEDAFEGKEMEWIIKDLGLESPVGKYFKLHITKVGLVEPRELNEEFFRELYPKDEIKSPEEFKEHIEKELKKQWDAESANQLQHSAYHILLEHTGIGFPETFLRNWLKSQGANNQPKTDDEVEKEFPSFLNQLKWTLISDKLIRENQIEVLPDEIRHFAKQQLLGYMGSEIIDEDQQWVTDYVDRIMKDRKYVEDAYSRLQTRKLFEWAEQQMKPEVVDISREEFLKLAEEHKHEH